MECDTKLSPCCSYELKWNHLLQAANTSTGMQGCNFHQGWGEGPCTPSSSPPPLFFAILFPVFNTETEIGFHSLIIRLVLVSHRPMIRVDELTQLCPTLRPTLPANLFSSFYRGTDWFLLPLSSEHNCLVFLARCVLPRVRLRLKSLAW